MKSENSAVSILSDLNRVPSLRKRVKRVDIGKGIRRRPNEIARQVRPYSDGETFKPGQGPKAGIPYLLDGQKLTNEKSIREGVCIHMETIAKGGISFEIASSDAPTFSVILNAADPDINVRGNASILSKGVANTSGEKRNTASLSVIKNDSLSEGKNRNRTRRKLVDTNSDLSSD